MNEHNEVNEDSEESEENEAEGSIRNDENINEEILNTPDDFILQQDSNKNWELSSYGRKKLQEYINKFPALEIIFNIRDSFETRSIDTIDKLKNSEKYCDPAIYLMLFYLNYHNKQRTMVDEVFTKYELEITSFPENIEGGIYLQNANLEMFSIPKIRLNNARFQNSNLSQCDFTGSEINRADMKNADFRGANFTSCIISNLEILSTEVNHANFSKAQFSDKTDFSGSSIYRVNFSDSSLQSAKFTNCAIEYCFFERSKLGKAKFIQSTVTECNFDFANLESTDFTSSDLSFSSFNNANCKNTDFTDTDLMQSNFSEANISFSKFYLSQLTETNFSKSVLKEMTLYNKKNKDFKTNRGHTKTKCENTRFFDALLSIYTKDDLNDTTIQFKEEKEFEAVEILSDGIVNNIQFIDPIFGRKVKYEALSKRLTSEYLKKKKFLLWEDFLIPISFKSFKSWGLFLWWISCDFGRSIKRWLILFLLMTVLFTFVNIIAIGNSLECNNQKTICKLIEDDFLVGFVTSLYYTVVTLTTLGFGDVIPKMLSISAKIIITFEVLVGYLLLGGLISLFANRLILRND